jgi:hypothetical protein
MGLSESNFVFAKNMIDSCSPLRFAIGCLRHNVVSARERLSTSLCWALLTCFSLLCLLLVWRSQMRLRLPRPLTAAPVGQVEGMVPSTFGWGVQTATALPSRGMSTKRECALGGMDVDYKVSALAAQPPAVYASPLILQQVHDCDTCLETLH